MAVSAIQLRDLKKEPAVQIKGFEHIEMYVGNVRQAAHYYRTAFGFQPVAYAGLETGVRDRTSIVLQQRDVLLVLTAGLVPDGPIARHVAMHGDDIIDIAFAVDNAAAAFEAALKRGAHPVVEPEEIEDDRGRFTKATIRGRGDMVHSFIEREGFEGGLFPNFQPIANGFPATPSGLTVIDHVAICTEAGTLDETVDFYIENLGFRHSYTEDILTEYSSMNSKVVENSTGTIKFPIVEPGSGKRKSQIEEYLTYHQGPGAQHVAFATEDMLQTVRELRRNGIEFLPIPAAYYQALKERIGEIDESLEELRQVEILVDRDEWGYLMQIFTRPLMHRPTVFVEIIQRKLARSFGGGNIRALFEAIEREQLLRGNL